MCADVHLIKEADKLAGIKVAIKVISFNKKGFQVQHPRL